MKKNIYLSTLLCFLLTLSSSNEKNTTNKILSIQTKKYGMQVNSYLTPNTKNDSNFIENIKNFLNLIPEKYEQYIKTTTEEEIRSPFENYKE